MVDEKPRRVPVVDQLSKIYQNVNNSLKEVHEKRFYNLKKRFEAQYGEEPRFFCRAPGRVNIIGEHIDYCGYSVLPAALDQDFIMAYSPSDKDEIVLNNVDKDMYAGERLSTDPYQKFKEEAHWINYFLCGYKAVLSLEDSPLRSKVSKPQGMKILIDSVVPPAAGLSSSSAFCVCAAVTTLHANGLINDIEQAPLAELVIKAERMAGTACGGMD
jgi:galactokinase